MAFSDRYGHISPRLQQDNIDSPTRNLLWNAINGTILSRAILQASRGRRNNGSDTNEYEFLLDIWINFLKKKKSTFSINLYSITIEMYLDKCEWYIYYDFIEFFTDSSNKYLSHIVEFNNLITSCTSQINVVLEQQLCPYRIAGGFIVPITNSGEIHAIDAALESTKNILSVHTHLKQAIQLFTDREKPDFRNSIKESISAIESLSKIIVNNPRVTLSDALKELRKSEKLHIHQSLLNSINSLYGWAGDEDGIRHAQKDESKITSEDAQFILTFCCGLTSYLISKSTRAEINLGNYEKP